MVADGDGVPAGWYPDPLGLQQLRWWDGASWTESTSAGAPADVDDSADEAVSEDAAEAVEPVLEPTPFSPAAEDPFAVAEANAAAFPSRRARRAFERQRELDAGLTEAPVSPFAELETNPIDIPLRAAAPAAIATATATATTVTATETTVTEAPAAPAWAEPSAIAIAIPAAADADAPSLGTLIDAREDVLAQSALAPQQPGPEDGQPFSFDSVEVAPEAAPERTLIPKRTYSFASWLMSMLVPLALAVLIVLMQVPDLSVSAELGWGIGAAALVIGVLLAFLDSAALARWGHARTASPLWALLTPMVYLSLRSVATRRETGHGRAVILAWVLGLVLAALLGWAFPEAIALLVPGFEPPWTSLIG